VRKTLQEIALILGAKVTGDGRVQVERLAGLDEAEPGDLTFLADSKLSGRLAGLKASALLLSESIKAQTPLPHIRVKDANLAMLTLAERYAQELFHPYPGRHPTAVIGRGVALGKGVSVGPFVVCEDGAQVGDESVLQAHVYVGRDARIGRGCVLYSHSAVHDRCVLGNRVILHSGSVIGADGFGYLPVDGRHRKIPQIGIVEIGDDVEIGANSTVDRARFGKTVVGSGTKIDNLVHIAHNVKIGKNCIFAAQFGVAGSSTIGDGVTAAGQVGIISHMTIGAGSTIVSKAAVMQDVPPGSTVSGIPAHDHHRNLREQAAARKLPELMQRIRDLEARLPKQP